jgi:hypothetical protein
MSSTIQESVNYLKKFNLKLSDDQLENDLKLIVQKPAIAVIGLVSRGKSTLVNKLVGEEIMPSDPNPESFGCAFLSSGSPSAFATLKNGTIRELSTSPSNFQGSIRRTPQTVDQIQDCTYTGELRLPFGVMLIDTKGLSEISSDFDDEMAGLDRSWATHGAIAAILVTSVPPGVSADDVRLFKSVHRHFEGRVLVVVKQTDSSVSLQDLEDTAQVWRQHGPNVVVISDDKPLLSDPWGSGPLSGLEMNIAKFWNDSERLRNIAVNRLNRALEDLARKIPVSTASTLTLNQYQRVIREGHENSRLLPNVRAIATDRMILEYQNRTSSVYSISSLRDLNEAFYMASIGSTHARQLIADTVNLNSPIRKSVGLGELVRVIWENDKLLFRKMFREIQFSSDSDFASIASVGISHPEIYQNWEDLGNSCYRYLYNITDERRLVSLFKDGGPAFSFFILSRLMEVWKSWISRTVAVQASIDDIATLVIDYQTQLEDSFDEISTEAIDLVKKMDSYLESWDTIGPKSHRPFAGSDIFEGPFTTIETTHALSLRICALLRFLPTDTRRQAIENEQSLRPQGSRRVWLRTTTTAIKAETRNERLVRAVLNWSAVAGVVLALIGLGQGGDFIIVGIGVSIASLTSRFLYSVIGTAWVRAYDPLVRAKTSKRKSLDLSVWAGTWIALTVVASGLFSSQIDARLHPKSEASTPIFVPPQSTFETETTVETTEAPFPTIRTFSLSDVTADGFTTNGEVNLSEYFLPEEGDSELMYRMAISDGYISLSESYQVKACWQQESIPDLLVSCTEGALVRIGRNDSGVIYETALQMKPNGPTGRWWLHLEFLGTSTAITSPTSLIIRTSENDSSNTTADSTPFVSTTAPPSSNYIDQSASAYASAMARWTSSGFQEMMNLSENNSPAWKYAFHLYNGRLSEIQAGRKDGSQVQTKPAGSGIRICLTSSCSTLLDNFEISNGRLYDLTINNRPVRDSVITNSESNSWVCGSFGACATLRSASWFGGTVYVNLEIQLNNSAAGTATRAAVVLVPPSGSTMAFTAGTTPLATIAQNAHYLVSFPYSSEPWPGAIRVKIKTSLGMDTLQVPLVNP